MDHLFGESVAGICMRRTASRRNRLRSVTSMTDARDPLEKKAVFSKANRLPATGQSGESGEAGDRQFALGHPHGVESCSSSNRRLIYRAEPFVIDLRLDSEPTGKRISLMGQVLTSSDPNKDMTQVEAILLRGGELLARTKADASGNFSFRFEDGQDLQLFINIQGNRAIGIVLPEGGL